MKKLIITTLILIIFGLLRTSSFAQESNNSKIFISPTFRVIEVDEDQQEVIESIKISTDSEKELNLTLEKALARVRSENISISKDDSELLENIQIDFTNIKIDKSRDVEIRVTIVDPNAFEYEYHPVVIVRESDVDDNQQVTVNPELSTIFYLEKLKGNIDFELTGSINKPSIISPEFNVSGKIKNTGDKMIRPSGEIQLYKNNTLLRTQEISTEILTNLLPGESIEFNQDMELLFNDVLDETGQFTAIIKVTPNPYNSTQELSLNILNFNYNLLVGFVASFVITFIIIVYLATVVIKPKEKKDRV